MLVATHRGLRDAASEAAQITSTGGSLATGTLGTLSAAGVMSVPALTIPLIGAGVAAVLGAIYLIKNSGCGQTCIIAADDANKIEPYLIQNLDGYFQGPRTVASQTAALANADYFLNYLAQACGNPALGDAGKRCISDRARGSCKWKQTAEGYAAHPYPGVPKPGECWDWYSGYRDPIANDPGVQASPTGHDAAVDQVLSSVGISGGLDLSKLLVPALIGLGIWAVMS